MQDLAGGQDPLDGRGGTWRCRTWPAARRRTRRARRRRTRANILRGRTRLKNLLPPGGCGRPWGRRCRRKRGWRRKLRARRSGYCRSARFRRGNERRELRRRERFWLFRRKIHAPVHRAWHRWGFHADGLGSLGLCWLRCQGLCRLGLRLRRVILFANRGELGKRDRCCSGFARLLLFRKFLRRLFRLATLALFLLTFRALDLFFLGALFRVHFLEQGETGFFGPRFARQFRFVGAVFGGRRGGRCGLCSFCSARARAFEAQESLQLGRGIFRDRARRGLYPDFEFLFEKRNRFRARDAEVSCELIDSDFVHYRSPPDASSDAAPSEAGSSASAISVVPSETDRAKTSFPFSGLEGKFLFR